VFKAALAGSLLRLRVHTPFFALLSLFADIRPSHNSQTDGFLIELDETRFLSESKPRRDAMLLHLLLHCAFRHSLRRGARDTQRWNMAADIVVNGIIASYKNLELAAEDLRIPELEHLSVEEIYQLLQSMEMPNPPQPDLLSPPSPESGQGDDSKVSTGEGGDNDQEEQENTDSSEGKGKGKQENQSGGSSQGGGNKNPSSPSNSNNQDQASTKPYPRDLDAHWKSALGNAQVMVQQMQQGFMPAGLEREFAMTEPQLPWRDVLSRYVCRRPVDFSGFDRRFFHRRLYIEALEGLSLNLEICIDTSGSVSNDDMADMLGEVSGMLSSYPNIRANLSYADAALYGPYPFESFETLPTPRGGGGTDFRPFFKDLEERLDPTAQTVAIYLTDGYGTFPEDAACETIWVVVPGGRVEYPFGEVVRMLK
jgi:predicted metal-dependent peptidase